VPPRSWTSTAPARTLHSLHSLTRSLEFMLGDRKDEWLAARLDDLDYGDIDGIEAAARAYPSKA
jgi:hypothetical protein